MAGQGHPLRYFRCRWCGERFAVYTHSQDHEVGQRVYGGPRLSLHVENEHPREYAALQRALDDEFGTLLPEDGEGDY